MIPHFRKETKGMIQMSFTIPLRNLDISMGLSDISQDLPGGLWSPVVAARGKADTQGHLRWHQKAKLKQLNPSEKVACSLGSTDCLFFTGYIGS